MAVYLGIVLPFHTSWPGPAYTTRIRPSTPQTGFDPYVAGAAAAATAPLNTSKTGSTIMMGKPTLDSTETCPFGCSVSPNPDGWDPLSTSRLSSSTTSDELHASRLPSRKAVLYVSTSREKWKRRQQEQQRDHHQTSTRPFRTGSPPPPSVAAPPAHSSTTSTNTRATKNKYEVKEEQLALALAMVCCNTASLAWMCGVDLRRRRRYRQHPTNDVVLEKSDSRLDGADDGDDDIDWDRILNPLELIYEAVHSDALAR